MKYERRMKIRKTEDKVTKRRNIKHNNERKETSVKKGKRILK